MPWEGSQDGEREDDQRQHDHQEIRDRYLDEVPVDKTGTMVEVKDRSSHLVLLATGP